MDSVYCCVKQPVDFCQHAEADMYELLDACLSIGQRMMDSQGTMLTYLIGLSLQKPVYEKYNNDVDVSHLSDLKKEFEEKLSLLFKATDIV